MLSALAAAHRAGLIHRDVKPENVLIADDGRVKVADFGLAKAVSADTQHTATGGVLIGTVSYLAPELVVDGRSDARADVYAAGVLLYELLTGKKPHEGESPIQVAYKHVHEDVPPPSRLRARASRRTSTPWSPGPPPATATSGRPTPACCCTSCTGSARPSATASASDPELIDDLLPRKTPTPPRRSAARDRRAATPVREPWDHAAMAALLGAAARGDHDVERPREPTTVTDRPQPVPPPAAPAEPTKRPRRRRRGPILLVLALLLAAAVGAGAWYFGWARYTSTPGVLG